MKTAMPNYATMSDTELNIAFALEVAGWQQRAHDLFWDPKARRARIPFKGLLHGIRSKMGLHSDSMLTFAFSTSIDDALPWLATCDSWQALFDQGEMAEYTVQVWAPHHATGDAATLARADDFALLKAKRAALTEHPSL